MQEMIIQYCKKHVLSYFLVIFSLFSSLILFSSPVNAQAVTQTLGFTSIGTAIDGGDQNSMNGSKVTMGTTDGSATSMSVYIRNVGASGSNFYQIAIYTDNNGPPASLD